MNEPTETKPNPFQKVVAAAKKHDRKILAVTTVISTGAAVWTGIGIHQYNVFLREHGLFDQFYGLTEDA